MPGNHVSTHLSDDHTYKRGDGWLTRQLAQLQSVAQRAGHCDVIHFHTDRLHLLFAARLPCPHVTTVYGPLCAEEHGPLLSEHPETPLVSTSAIQRRPVPWMNWRATIFYGLAVQPVSSNAMASAGDYLLFMGHCTTHEPRRRRQDRRTHGPAFKAGVRSSVRASHAGNCGRRHIESPPTLPNCPKALAPP